MAGANDSGLMAGKAFLEMGLNDAGLVNGLKTAEAKLQAFALAIRKIGEGDSAAQEKR